MQDNYIVYDLYFLLGFIWFNIWKTQCTWLSSVFIMWRSEELKYNDNSLWGQLQYYSSANEHLGVYFWQLYILYMTGKTGYLQSGWHCFRYLLYTPILTPRYSLGCLKSESQYHCCHGQISTKVIGKNFLLRKPTRYVRTYERRSMIYSSIHSAEHHIWSLTLIITRFQKYSLDLYFASHDFYACKLE